MHHGDAATGSFLSSLETLVGRTDLEIVANGGVDEMWAGRLAALPVNATFAPVIETQAAIEGTGSVTVYGIDAVARWRDSDGAVVSSALARRLRLEKNGTLSLTLNDAARDFRVVDIVDAKDAEFVLLDIAAAQQALNEYGRLDRIEVFAGPRQDFAALEHAIRATLPAGYEVRKPGARSDENQRMLRAFRWNLLVLSYVSLVVGAFLIYNTISVSVVRRRPEIGVLRALGAGRQRILWLFLGEALLFGIAGSAAGVLLGRVLALGAVGLIGQTVNALYVSSRPAPVALHGADVALAILSGVSVAFFAALAPALEAMRVAPTEAMGRGAHEHQARLHWRRDLAWAALIALLAVAVSRIQPIDGKPVAGYVATLLAIASAALAAPAVVIGVSSALRPAARALAGAEGLLAGRGLSASLGRTAVVVGALATAIAMMASVGIMVGSFRETVVVWLDTQLRADLYVRPAARGGGAGQFPALAQEIPALVARTPGVEAVDIFHGLEVRYGGLRATLGAGNADIVRRYGRLRFLPGEDRDTALRSLIGQDRVVVSEPFAYKHHVRAGETLKLPLGDRNIAFTVAGIYYDYSSERGLIILDRGTLLKYLPQQPVTNLAIYLQPGADAIAVRHAIEQRTARHHILIAPNQSLRETAVMVFDRTFAITYALEGVAIAVAMLGAANSLLAMVLDRRRELGLLRYLGAAPSQLRRMILLEAGMVGFMANLLGLALGFALSLLLVYVINKQSFGWTIQFHPPAGLLAGALSLVWATTILAGFYPARVASRLNPIEVIHDE